MNLLRIERTMSNKGNNASSAAPRAELVANLEQSATDMDPAVASVCSQLAGIWLALQRLRSEKPKHTMEDMHHYQNVRDVMFALGSNWKLDIYDSPDLQEARAHERDFA